MNRHKHRKGAAMKYFAGLDVSLGETAICVVDETGRIVREVRAASEPQALIAALSELGLDLERIGLEARSEEHTSELQSLMRISYAVFCLKKKNRTNTNNQTINYSR